MKYIIVGNSAAGLFAAESIRCQEPNAEITVLTADRYPSYSRCLTTYYLAGDIDESHLYLRTPEALAALRLDLHYECPVVGLDPEHHQILTASDQAFAYDKCLIATGASAVTLDIPGASLPEVFTLRHLENAQIIKSLLAPGRRAMVIGGGLVSLKSAYALRKQGLKVSVIVSSGRLLSQMLNYEAATILESHLKEHGLDIVLNSDVTAIQGREHVEAVQLRGGETRPADLIIVGKGVRPNTSPFLDSGLEIHQGILVNERLETNLPDVYAAGDVAETWDLLRQSRRINAIWPNATQQGSIAGSNMAGRVITYPGSLSMNAVDFFGLRLVSVGIINPPPPSETTTLPHSAPWHTEEIRAFPSGEIPTYQRLVWQGNTLKGFVLMGNAERAGILTGLIQTSQPLTPLAQECIQNGYRGRILATLYRSSTPILN